MNWDEYYLNICKGVGQNSKCHSRQIGSILVKDKIIISTGYNGPARGIQPCNARFLNDPVLIKESNLEPMDYKLQDAHRFKICPRKFLGYKSGEGLEWCPAVHAEKNCLLAAARMGIATKGATLYIDANVSSCTQCFSGAVNAGIAEIVVVENNIYDPTLEWVMKNTFLKVREFKV